MIVDVEHHATRHHPFAPQPPNTALWPQTG